MSTEVAVRYIFIYKEEPASSGIVLSHTINAMTQKANKVWVAKLWEQIQTEFKVSDWIFPKQTQTSYGNIGSIL